MTKGNVSATIMVTGGIFVITQQELLGELGRLGTPITAPTLRSRIKNELVVGPYKGGSGRQGRTAFYPDRAIAENYATSKMLNWHGGKLSAADVKPARSLALSMERNAPIDKSQENVFEIYPKKDESENLDFNLAVYWLAYLIHALAKATEKFACRVIFGLPSQSDELYEINEKYSFIFATSDCVNDELRSVHVYFINVKTGQGAFVNFGAWEFNPLNTQIWV